MAPERSFVLSSGSDQVQQEVPLVKVRRGPPDVCR